jgi:hypothetical protein
VHIIALGSLDFLHLLNISSLSLESCSKSASVRTRSPPKLPTIMNNAKDSLLSEDPQSIDYRTRYSIDDGSENDFEQIPRPLCYGNGGIEPRILYFGMAVILLIGLYGLVFYAGVSNMKALASQPIEYPGCGNTSAEALTNGCVFNFVSGAWVHPDCHDAELDEEFLQVQNWHWYADAENKHELTRDFIRQTGGPNPIYVSIEYHQQHCAYTWKKLHRAVIQRKPIDSAIGVYRHTDHCTKALMASNLSGPSAFYHIFASCKLPSERMCFISNNRWMLIEHKV